MCASKNSDYIDKPIPELVKALCDHAQPGSQRHEEIKGALQVALSAQLSESIDRHERAATKLANQLLALNIILGLFTIAGTVLTILGFALT
jgi:hypothetical protein